MMTEEDTYWNNPRAYYLSAAVLFLFMIFILLWMLIFTDFWNSVDPTFKFMGYVGIFAPAGLGLFMILLGRSVTGRQKGE